MNEPDLITGALDSLGVALADHDHEWTEGEREIYEQAIEEIQALRKERDFRTEQRDNLIRQRSGLRTELEALRAQITASDILLAAGTAELKQASAAISERDDLRDENATLTKQRDEARAAWVRMHCEREEAFNASRLLRNVAYERDAALAQADTLRRDRDSGVAIINRVWAALGLATYEDAKGKVIDECVTDLRKRVTELEEVAAWALPKALDSKSTP